MFNYNEAEKQGSFGIIPKGEVVPVQMNIRAKHGDMPGMGPNDQGLFKQTKDGDAYMIDVEYQITAGEHAKRKVWEFICAKGNGSEGHVTWENIAKTKLRAILESAHQIDPDDVSDDAIAKRQISGFDDLQNVVFTARVGIESQDGYDDKNTLTPITCNEDDYRPPVGPSGGNVEHVATAANTSTKPAAKSAKPSW